MRYTPFSVLEDIGVYLERQRMLKYTIFYHSTIPPQFFKSPPIPYLHPKPKNYEILNRPQGRAAGVLRHLCGRAPPHCAGPGGLSDYFCPGRPPAAPAEEAAAQDPRRSAAERLPLPGTQGSAGDPGHPGRLYHYGLRGCRLRHPGGRQRIGLHHWLCLQRHWGELSGRHHYGFRPALPDRQLGGHCRARRHHCGPQPARRAPQDLRRARRLHPQRHDCAQSHRQLHPGRLPAPGIHRAVGQGERRGQSFRPGARDPGEHRGRPAGRPPAQRLRQRL